ncbi:hypothetical protein [Micromonospora sp. LOL_023]|uniref:hypothetical protein n=1 Tax=Micromonospora sp. LOL_023 TaxID=3345418 RepID=UPI003A8B3073
MSNGALLLPYPHLLPASQGQLRQAIADSGQSRIGEQIHHPEIDDFAAQRAPHGDPAETDYQEHDRYFQIRRTLRTPGRAFLSALVIAQNAVAENARKNDLDVIGDADLPQLRTGFESLLRYAGPASPPAAGSTPAQPAPPSAQRPGRSAGDQARAATATAAAERWLVGHQLFFVLVQGTITGLNCFLGASAAGDESDARAALRVAAAFMRSSAAAFRFASDFAPVDYEQLIRPAMAPPAVRAGFSGLQTRDHAYLMGLFAEVRLMRAKIGAARLGEAFEEFVEATIAAYEAHQLICARFGGDVLPSLRMAARSGGRSAAPGVQAVRQLMRARLFALDDTSRDATRDGGGRR